MDKQQLQDRLAQLQTEKVQAAAIYDGAIQDCSFWLEQLNKKEDDGQEPDLNQSS